MPKKNEDKKILKEAMDRVAKGIFEPVDEAAFTDTELAQSFNAMVAGIAERNNRHLMRINAAMSKIGNGQWIKKLFDLISYQQEVVARLQDINKEYNKDVHLVEDDDIETLTLIKQLKNNIEPCIDGINEIIVEVSNTGEIGSISDETLDHFKRLLLFNSKTLMAMLEQAKTAIDRINAGYESNKEKNALAEPLIEEAKKLTESCDSMSLECFNAGHNMYEISRMVDDERNDMFRYNSAPSVHEHLQIYKIDHIVVTWRLYNHIQEYEMLRLEQVNNPDRCKLGLWLRHNSPEWIRKTGEYKAVYDAHEKLHVSAVKCYEAKENYDMAKAMKEFETALSDLEVLLEALDSLDAIITKKEENEKA